MKKAAAIIVGFFALIGARLYVGQEPAPVESPSVVESDLQSGIADAVALKVAVKLGLDPVEAKEEIPKTQKLQRAINRGAEAFADEMVKPIVKAAAVQEPAPEPTPDPISTEIVVEEQDEPKPLTEYQFARMQAQMRNVPLVLFITQDGCAPCKEKLAKVIEPMEQSGEFDSCRFQVLNRSTDKTAASIAGQTGVPQVIVYRVLDDVTPGARLVGNQITAANVRSLLKGSK